MRVRSFTEVEKVTIEDATFDVAPIPDGVWRTLRLRGLQAQRDATRRALIDLRAAGEEPTEERVAEWVWLDTRYRDEVEAAMRETVAWGIRGHQVAGLEWAGQEREWMGRHYRTTSDATVAEYADTDLDAGGSLLQALYLKVAEQNSLSPASKKNSPPQSPPPAGAGPAPTA